MLTYAVEYSVMNDEAFSAFFSESSAPQQPTKATIQRSSTALVENKLVQTEDSRESTPTGESHPILGELIQRQNADISKLKQEKSELRKDIQTLLQCVLTMQKLAKISSKGAICPPVPPQVTDIASKYVTGGANYFSSVMENGWANEASSLSGYSMRETTLKAVDEFDERTEESRYYGISSRDIGTKLASMGFKARGSLEDRSSSHGIPPLDQDSDDNSDHSSHHFTFESSSSAVRASSIQRGAADGMGSSGNGTDKLAHNSSGLNVNKISTILM